MNVLNRRWLFWSGVGFILRGAYGTLRFKRRGRMALSLVGMLIAFGGCLPPVGGAIFQEVIDLGAVLNALRAAVPGGELTDY